MYRAFLLPLVFSLCACGGGSSGSDNKPATPANNSSNASSTSSLSASSASGSTTAGIKEIVSNFGAFAALLNNGKVITWGHTGSGGDTSSIANELVDVIKIYSTDFAFAALKKNGTVVAWGSKDYGGDASLVNSELTDVVSITASMTRFAAIKKDSTAVIWGWYIDSTPAHNKLTDVKEISFVAGSNLVIALKNDGALQFLHAPESDIPISTEFTNIVDAERVVTSHYSFSIIKKDGWIAYSNRDSGDFFLQPQQYQSIQEIYLSDDNYVALKNDGTISEWGLKYNDATSNDTSIHLNNVKKIIPGSRSFAALKNDGTIENWGDCYTYSDGRVGAQELVPKDLNMVIDVVSLQRTGSGETCTYAALRSDGSVATWGHVNLGGNSENVQPYLTNVKKIIATSNAFAALKADNTVVYWGNLEREYGKDIQAELTDVTDIYATDVAFAAVRKNGSIVTWGQFVADGIVHQ